MNKYKSIFAPNLDVGTEAFITELIIDNKLNWQMQKNPNIHKPNCAFWRKEIAAANPAYKELQKDYGVEISYVKDLLKSFSAKTIIGYIKERKIITFRYLPLDKQKTVIYNLWKAECLNQKADTEQAKKAVNIEDTLTSIVQNRPTQKTALTGLLD